MTLSHEQIQHSRFRYPGICHQGLFSTELGCETSKVFGYFPTTTMEPGSQGFGSISWHAEMSAVLCRYHDRFIEARISVLGSMAKAHGRLGLDAREVLRSHCSLVDPTTTVF